MKVWKSRCLCCGRWVEPDRIVCAECADLDSKARGHVFMGREKEQWTDGY
jgi:uncharacterized OB-fold protein